MLPDNYIPDTLEEASDLLQDVQETFGAMKQCDYETIRELNEFCVDRMEAVKRFLLGG